MTRWCDPRSLGAECDRCPLGPRGKLRPAGEPWVPVPNQHQPDSMMAAVADMPGPEEEEMGYPFAGQSGEWWQKGLAAIDLRRTDVAILNTQLCRFPGPASGARARQDAALKKARDTRAAALERELRTTMKPSVATKSAKAMAEAEIPDPTACCRPALEREVSRYPFVFALGGAAARGVAGMTGSIQRNGGDLLEIIRGSVPSWWPAWRPRGSASLDDTRLVWDAPMPDPALFRPVQRVLPTFHPAFVSRSPGNFHRWTAHLAKGLRWFQGQMRWIPVTALMQPTPDELEAFLSATDAPFWVADYETNGINPLDVTVRCVGFCIPDLNAAGEAALPTEPVVTPARAVGIHFVKCAGGTGGLREDADAAPGRYYSPLNETRILRLIAAAFEDGRLWTGNNFSIYDWLVTYGWKEMRAVMGRAVQIANVLETMNLSRARNPEVSKGLKAVGTELLDVEHWETNEKGEKNATSEKVTDWERLDYCAQAGDVVVNARITPILMKAARERGYFDECRLDLKPASWPDARPWTLAEIDVEAQAMWRQMHILGIHVDSRRVAELTQIYEEREAEKRAVVQEIAAKYGYRNISVEDDVDDDEEDVEIETSLGHELNPGAYGQIRSLMYDKWKLGKPVFLPKRDFETQSGLPGTGDAVLRAQLARNDLSLDQRRFIGALRLQRRYGPKALSTILRRMVPRAASERGLVYADGRVRSTFNGAITAPARGASSNPNLQNLGNKKGQGPIKSIFTPKPVIDRDGCWLRYFIGGDLDQAHLRTIANYWGIKALLDAFELELDPHGMLAVAIYGEAAYFGADGWDGPPSLKKKPRKGRALAIRDVKKNLRYGWAYKGDNSTALRLLQAVELDEEEAAARFLSLHGRKPTSPELIDATLPNIRFQEKLVAEFREKWLSAEREWEPAWDRMAAEYAANGYMTEPVLGRRSGVLSGGKIQEVVNFPILAAEPSVMRLAEWRVRELFSFEHAGPGTGLVYQCHDSMTVETVGGRVRRLSETDVGFAERGMGLPEGWHFDAKRRLAWCPIVERQINDFRHAMTVHIPGWPVTYTVEAGCGLNLKEV